MKINKYWISPEKKQKQKVAMISIIIISIAIGYLSDSRTFTIINGAVVDEQSEAGTFVDPQLTEQETPAPVYVVVSAYSEYDSCHYPKIINGERKCLVASGKIATAGMVASNKHTFGTKLIIGGREFTVEDRTAERYSNRIDIFMGYGDKGYAKATKWGLKTLSVTKK